MASHASKLWVLLGLGIAGILLVTIREDFGAFIDKLLLIPSHPLTGLSFAVSHVFDITGYVTGFGHPDWVRTHEELAEMAKEKGNQAFEEKQWHKAIALYSEAIKLSDNTATYYTNRAAAYLEVGSLQQAEEDCTKAITLDEKNVKAYVHRGTAREIMSYYEEALDDFKYALVLEPNNKRAAKSAERLRKLFECP